MEISKPREKCAVVGVVGPDAAVMTSEVLFALQHRGTEASGLASENEEGDFNFHREQGMVKDVFRHEVIPQIMGNIAVGHNKYTSPGVNGKHLQPVIDRPIGFALAHNGNLPVTNYLKTVLENSNIKTHRLDDSEMMGLAVAQNIRSGHTLGEAIGLNYDRFKGSFSSIAMHDGVLAGFKDPFGIRPLSIGQVNGHSVLASETCGLDFVGAEFIREVEPGEMILIDEMGNIHSELIHEGQSKLDIFELIYFARPDSILYGERVNEIRRRFGEQLAVQHPPTIDRTENILVVPVPDTSVPAAEGYAEKLGLQFRQAIVKNRYIGRTFIKPNDEIRQHQLKRKHNIIPEAIAGRDVTLIDDSIVRLNTMPRLVEQVCMAGARSVRVLIASPPVRFPDFYGIDTSDQSELAAAQMTVKQIRDRIGCISLGYLSLSRMIEATNRSADDFCLSSFTGEYPINIGEHARNIQAPVSQEYMD